MSAWRILDCPNRDMHALTPKCALCDYRVPGGAPNAGARGECIYAGQHFVMNACPECDYIEEREPLSTGPNIFRGVRPIRSEVRVTDPVTGGQKGQKPEQYSLIPVEALAEVARVYGEGAKKYAPQNWRLGYSWSLSYDALQRHINAFWRRESADPDDGLHHLAHAAFHLFSLMTFEKEGLGTDDRV